GAETARIWRHRCRDEIEQVPGRPITPRVQECAAGKRRRFVAAGEIGHVTVRAVDVVGSTTGGGLCSREDGGRWLLPGGDCCQRCRDARATDKPDVHELAISFALAARPHRLHPNAVAALGTPPRRELTLTPRRGF